VQIPNIKRVAGWCFCIHTLSICLKVSSIRKGIYRIRKIGIGIVVFREVISYPRQDFIKVKLYICLIGMLLALKIQYSQLTILSEKPYSFLFNLLLSYRSCARQGSHYRIKIVVIKLEIFRIAF